MIQGETSSQHFEIHHLKALKTGLCKPMGDSAMAASILYIQSMCTLTSLRHRQRQHNEVGVFRSANSVMTPFLNDHKHPFLHCTLLYLEINVNFSYTPFAELFFPPTLLFP